MATSTSRSASGRSTIGNKSSISGWSAVAGNSTNSNSGSSSSSGGGYNPVPASAQAEFQEMRRNLQQQRQQEQQPQQPEFDIQSKIDQMKQAQINSRIAALDKAKNSAITALDTEKENVSPTYYDKRNQAAANSDVGAMNFAQFMAARGIKGAAGAMPEVYRQAGLQGQIGALDRQEAADLSAIERQRASVETGYASDVTAANADAEAQAMQTAITQYNADRAYKAQQAAAELEQQKFDWSKSSDNPSNQYQILAAKKAALDNAAQEIQNSYLPETLKLKAESLRQDVEKGYLDIDKAQAQLDQMLSGGSGGGYSGGGSSGGSSMSYNTALTRATELAKADPRLAGKAYKGYDESGQEYTYQTQADGVNYFTLPQLIDAYMTQIAYETRQ